MLSLLLAILFVVGAGGQKTIAGANVRGLSFADALHRVFLLNAGTALPSHFAVLRELLPQGGPMDPSTAGGARWAASHAQIADSDAQKIAKQEIVDRLARCSAVGEDKRQELSRPPKNNQWLARLQDCSVTSKNSIARGVGLCALPDDPASIFSVCREEAVRALEGLAKELRGKRLSSGSLNPLVRAKLETYYARLDGVWPASSWLKSGILWLLAASVLGFLAFRLHQIRSEIRGKRRPDWSPGARVTDKDKD